MVAGDFLDVYKDQHGILLFSTLIFLVLSISFCFLSYFKTNRVLGLYRDVFFLGYRRLYYGVCRSHLPTIETGGVMGEPW